MEDSADVPDEEKCRRTLISVLVNRAVYCDGFMAVCFGAGRDSSKVVAAPEKKKAPDGELRPHFDHLDRLRVR